MKEIRKIIDELRANNSLNYKKEVLTKYVDNEVFKLFLVYVYNPRWNYWIAKIPEDNFELTKYPIDFLEANTIFLTFDKLKNRELIGNDAINYVTRTMNHYFQDGRELFELILNRDLKCNVGIKIINEVFDNLLPEVPYMRCSPFDKGDFDKIFTGSEAAICQKKADGIFSYIIKQNNNVTCLTRTGTEWSSNKLNVELQFLPNDTVLIGEALVKDGEKEFDRKTGNGLINSFIKRFTTVDSLAEKINVASEKAKVKLLQKWEDANVEWTTTENNIYFEVWDILKLYEFERGHSKTPYKTRLLELETLLPKLCTSVLSLSEYELVYIKEEALAFGQKMMENKYEGAILKSPYLLFENKTSRLQVKIKAELDCDLRVVGWEMGTGKYDGMIGSLICESSDGNLIVNVGTGLTDKDRSRPFADYLGKIVTIKYNERIKAKDSSKYSLFLPVFIEIREDKTEADNLEDIK